MLDKEQTGDNSNELKQICRTLAANSERRSEFKESFACSRSHGRTGIAADAAFQTFAALEAELAARSLREPFL